MCKPKPLLEGAKETLRRALQRAKSKAEFQRIQCVWLRAALGLSSAQVAIGWRPTSVRRVQSLYLRQAEVVLLGVGRGGRRQNLTGEQERQWLEPFVSRAEPGGHVGRQRDADRLRASGGPRRAESNGLSPVGSPGMAQAGAPGSPSERRSAAPTGLQKKLPAIVAREVKRQVVRGSRVGLMFQDEARFGRIHEPRRCWAPQGVRPAVGRQIVRPYSYAYAAVGPTTAF